MRALALALLEGYTEALKVSIAGIAAGLLNKRRVYFILDQTFYKSQGRIMPTTSR
jgi:hypothetical protein